MSNPQVPERQRADRLHFAYLQAGLKDDYPLQPSPIPGTNLLRIDKRGLMGVNEKGELIFRPDIGGKIVEVVLPTTYSNRDLHGQTIRKIERIRREAEQEMCVDPETKNKKPVNPNISRLFHPKFKYAPSIEVLDRYFQVLYHPGFNARVRAYYAAREHRREEREKKEELVQNYILSTMLNSNRHSKKD